MKKKKAKRLKLNSPKKKKTKRINKPVKTQRKEKKHKARFKVVIRDWGNPFNKHKEKELNEESKLELHIDGARYTVSIDKKNGCLQFSTSETHLYLQPISVHQFLVKANSKKK